jgi:hypothetical protein
MISGAQHRRTAQTITRALFALVIAIALWLLRPGVPALPRSFSAPLTIETIEGVVLWLLWLIGTLLALALFTKTRRPKPRPPLSTLASRNRSTWSPLRAVRPRSERPSLVIVSPERMTAAPALHEGRAVEEQPHSFTVDDSPPQDVSAGVRPRVSVLGPLAITGGKRSRRGLRARALEVIAYLALHPRPVHRDELLEAFWPGEDPRRTRPRLRQAVRDARRLLGEAIAGEGEQYWLARTGVDVDLDELEQLLAEASTVEPERIPILIERALRLFRGEPLAGSDYAWSENELPRLRATFVDLLEQVGRRASKPVRHGQRSTWPSAVSTSTRSTNRSGASRWKPKARSGSAKPLPNATSDFGPFLTSASVSNLHRRHDTSTSACSPRLSAAAAGSAFRRAQRCAR